MAPYEPTRKPELVIHEGNADTRGTHGVAGSLAPAPVIAWPEWEDALDTTLRVINAA